MQKIPEAKIYPPEGNRNKISIQFDERYDVFLNELANKRNGSYIDLDKNRELEYMKIQRYRFKAIFLSLPHTEDQIKILDIGTTPFTFFIKKFYSHYDISTIDLTDLMKERCKKNNIAFKKCDLTTDNIPFVDNHFDVVIFTDVFEHLLCPPSKVLTIISRILKRDGILIFRTPNYAALLKRIKLLIGLNPQEPVEEQFKEGWVHGYGHVREYTMKECVDILRNNGFIIKESKYDACWDTLSIHLELLGSKKKRILLFFPMLVYVLICLLVPPFRSSIQIVGVNKKM